MRTVGDDVKHALCVRLINRVKSALSGLSLRRDPYLAGCHRDLCTDGAQRGP